MSRRPRGTGDEDTRRKRKGRQRAPSLFASLAEAFVNHTLATNVGRISGECPANFGRISGEFLANFGRISGENRPEHEQNECDSKMYAITFIFFFATLTRGSCRCSKPTRGTCFTLLYQTRAVAAKLTSYRCALQPPLRHQSRTPGWKVVGSR